jgi:hypothetical protein
MKHRLSYKYEPEADDGKGALFIICRYGDFEEKITAMGFSKESIEKAMKPTIVTIREAKKVYV